MSTIDDIEKAAVEAFPLLRTGFSHCDVDKVNLIMEQFARLEAKYPEIAREVVQLKAESMLTRHPFGRFHAIDKISFGSSRLIPESENKYSIAVAFEYFSDYGDKELLKKELLKERDSGYLPDNIPDHELVKSILTHEFAHVLDKWIGKNIIGGERFIHGKQFNDFYSTLNDVDIKTMLCRGAAAQNSEFMAYAFMEYFHARNPRYISKYLLELVSDVLKCPSI